MQSFGVGEYSEVGVGREAMYLNPRNYKHGSGMLAIKENNPRKRDEALTANGMITTILLIQIITTTNNNLSIP